MNTKKLLVSALAAGALGVSLTIGAAPAASADTCSQIAKKVHDDGYHPSTGEKWACASTIVENKWSSFPQDLTEKWTGYPDRLAEKWNSWPGGPDPEPVAEPESPAPAGGDAATPGE